MVVVVAVVSAFSLAQPSVSSDVDDVRCGTVVWKSALGVLAVAGGCGCGGGGVGSFLLELGVADADAEDAGSCLDSLDWRLLIETRLLFSVLGVIDVTMAMSF